MARRARDSAANWQGSVVEVYFQFTFSFLVLEMEYYRHRFCSAEL